MMCKESAPSDCCAALAAAPDDTNPYSTSELAASQGSAAASTSFTADPVLHFWNNRGILGSSFITRGSKHHLLFHKTQFVKHKIIGYSRCNALCCVSVYPVIVLVGYQHVRLYGQPE